METTEDEDDVQSGVNPSLSDLKPEDLEKMKGDAIGNTMYSERWVLKVLMKLNKVGEDLGDEFESELCSLWDMTVEKDVVALLLKYDILSLIFPVISRSSNSRFIEIMVGILGNMCCFETTRSELSKRPEAVEELLKMLDHPDAHVLIQLVRLLLATAWDLMQDRSGNPPHWIELNINNGRLVNFFVFVLKSSTNEELLHVALEFLFTVCSLEINDKDFSQPFTSSEMASSLLDAWQQLFSSWSPEDGFSNKLQNKAAAHWTSVLCSFTNHEEGRKVLCEFGPEIGRILFNLVNRPIDYFDVILISSVTLLEGIISVYFDEVTFKRVLEVMNTLIQNSGEQSNDQSPSENLDALLQGSIESYCSAVFTTIDRPRLNTVLSQCNENHILLFWKTISDRQVDDSGDLD